MSNFHNAAFALCTLRIYDYVSMRNYSNKTLMLLQALSDPLPSTRSAGLVMSWDQSSVKLYTGGDSRHIQVWNAASEMKEQVGYVRGIPRLTVELLSQPIVI